MARKRVTKEEAQERLDKFNMTLIIYNGMSKNCIVQCNQCGDFIRFSSTVNATTEPNKFGGNHGCRLCSNNNIDDLKIKLAQVEFRYYQILEEAETVADLGLHNIVDNEKVNEDLMLLEGRIEALKNKIKKLEKNV